jgi:hypothetical protein
VFHLCTPFQDYIAHLRQLFGDITQSVLANALTCALTIAVQAVGLDANKTPEGRKISQVVPIFLSDPPSCPKTSSKLRILTEVSE